VINGVSLAVMAGMRYAERSTVSLQTADGVLALLRDEVSIYGMVKISGHLKKALFIARPPKTLQLVQFLKPPLKCEHIALTNYVTFDVNLNKYAKGMR